MRKNEENAPADPRSAGHPEELTLLIAEAEIKRELHRWAAPE